MVGAIGPKRVDCHVTAAPLLVIYIFCAKTANVVYGEGKTPERLYIHVCTVPI